MQRSPIFVFNATMIEYGTSAMSEALFTFVVLSGVALVVAARLDTDGSQWRWAAAGLCFGAAYFVRYSGLFFVLGFALVLIRHLLASNRALAKRYAIVFSWRASLCSQALHEISFLSAIGAAATKRSSVIQSSRCS